MMFNQFQQRMAYLGFVTTPITAEQYDLLLAAGYDDDVIEDIASDVASGWPLQDAIQAYD
jgi:hypothetical protein